MFFLDSENIKKLLSGIIHSETQLHQRSVDLSVSEIHRFKNAGSLDFGGSEFKAAVTEHLSPVKQSLDDTYGWWNLEEGVYKAVFNESVKKPHGSAVIISPHSHAIAAGLIVNTRLFSDEGDIDPLTLNFRVPPVGCNIKENARLAVLHIMEI